jgi:hypothetical protein
MVNKTSFNDFKDAFLEECGSVSTIDELKELYAVHLAKKDILISELQKENQLLLKTMFKEKKGSISLNKK